MKASELRIGNFVNSIAEGLRSGYGKVKSIEEDGAVIMFRSGHIKRIPSDYLEPIAVTEEILSRYGFNMYDYEFETDDSDAMVYYQKLKEGTDKCFFEVGLMPCGEHEFIFKSHYADAELVIAKFSHLHQLQNLYFTLTGQELTIEL